MPGRRTRRLCVKEIEESDAFFGVYAHRYGYIARGSSISITEREFDVARKSHKPTFCFVIDEDFPWPPKFIDAGPARSKLKTFQREGLKESYPRHFHDARRPGIQGRRSAR